MGLQSFTEAYKEIADHVNAEIAEVKWVDMWHNQITFLEDGYAFPFPAVFVSFRTDDIRPLPGGVQDIKAVVEFRLAVHTLADSYEGSANQDSALEFNDLLTKLYLAFQQYHSDNFSEMNRVGFAPEEAPANIIHYRMSFTSNIRDYSKQDSKATTTVTDPPMAPVQPGGTPANNDTPLYTIPT